MKLYNQAMQTFDVDKKEVIKGGSYRPHDAERKFLQIKHKDKFEVTDAYGKKLMRMYPNAFMQLDEAGTTTVKKDRKPVNRVKKAAKKAKKKLVTV